LVFIPALITNALIPGYLQGQNNADICGPWTLYDAGDLECGIGMQSCINVVLMMLNHCQVPVEWV